MCIRDRLAYPRVCRGCGSQDVASCLVTASAADIGWAWCGDCLPAAAARESAGDALVAWCLDGSFDGLPGLAPLEHAVRR
eukprot:4645397-Alexandrium_andersonii.AAC.1